MIYLYLTILLLIGCFSFVIFFGAPYLPTLSKQRETALDLLELKKGQTLLELGSGDGRMLVTAAKRGIKSVGIELNPIMYLVSLALTFRYRKNIKVIWGNLWRKDWPTETDGVFIFLMDKYMPKFNRRIKAFNKPLKVASFAFKIPGKKAIKEKNGVFLYQYK